MKAMARWAGVAVLAAGAGWAALGDGGTRPATQAEKAFALKVGTTFTKVMPTAPAGWRVAEQSKPEAPSWMPLGDRPHPMQVGAMVKWQDDKKLQESQTKMMQAMGSIKKDPADEARLKVLGQKQGQLAKALGDAAGKGDTAALGKIQKELEPVNKEMADIMNRQAKAYTTAMSSASARDAEVEIHLKANETELWLPERASKEAPVAGGIAYRVEEEQREGEGWREGTTYVLVGSWKTLQEGGATRLTAETAGAPTTSLKTLLVEVKADKARARGILEKLDWASLKALM